MTDGVAASIQFSATRKISKKKYWKATEDGKNYIRGTTVMAVHVTLLRRRPASKRPSLRPTSSP